MENVLRILLRDFKRLLKAPAALIVAGALLVLPSLYTWYNVVAFWDPYNATGNLSVCVVNEDAGVTNEMTGRLDIGDELIEELEANDQLDWITDRDYDTAIADLKAGDVYAVYVVPEDFSSCLISPLTGEAKSPHIEYYANEKLGPVSPKVTDTAASTLEQKINSTFVATVTEVATQAIDDAVAKAESDVAAAQDKASNRADAAKKAIAEVRENLSGIEDTIDDAQSKLAEAKSAVGDMSAIAGDAKAVLKDVTNEAEALQSTLSDVTSGAVPKLSDTVSKLSEVTEKAGSLAEGIVLSTDKAQADADIVAAKIQPVVDAMRDAASDLEAASDAIHLDRLKEKLGEAAQDMNGRADEVQAVLDGVSALAAQAGEASKAASEASGTLSEAAAKASDALSQYSSDLYGSAASKMDSSVAQVGGVCAQLSAAVSSLDAIVDQVGPIIDQLDGILADSKTAVAKTDGLIGSAQSDLDSVMADARMLAQSDVIANLVENGTLNARNISEFMGSPTELSTTEFYHPNAYGTAMAPLFMNLTFWIGAFMLVVIFLLEVDSEGIEDPKPWQRYLARFFMFCVFAAAQAAICCAGTLALGVEAANVPALFGAAVAASLAYMSIIYALSATFRHVGKALCIVLVFAQIPGASGLYPVEMTSSFFQAIYPLLPFTYGIDAMRESIGGFYGSCYAQDMLALGVFFFGNLAFGLIVGPLMSNVVRMTSRQIREGDLYNGADELTPERPYRLAHMLRALFEKESYREELEARYARFSRRYPIFIRASIVLGVGVPVVIGLLLALDTAEKTVLLTCFLAWLVALIGFLVVVESQRYSFERQLNLNGVNESGLLRIFANRNRMVRASARHTPYGEGLGEGEGTAQEEPWKSGVEGPHGATHAGSGPFNGIRNVWLIARRDFSGLFKNVMSVVITVGLVVLPSLFAWYNILAYWNVFDNTSHLSVAVASEDEGFESDLLPVNVNVGEKVVSALRGNDQINWVFTDADDAVEGVKAGRYYAALVIPGDFSRDMLTFYEGDSNSATINYYVNEKKNAIAPNITGIGADTVSYEVNTAFANAVSEVAIGAAKSLSELAEKGDADGRVASLAAHMRAVSERLDQSADVLSLYSSLSKNSQGLVQGGAEAVASVKGKLKKAAADIDAGRKSLKPLVAGISDSAEGIGESLDRADSAVADLEARADELIANASDEVSAVASQLRDKAAEIDGKVTSLSDALAALEKLRDELKSGVSSQIDIDISDGKAGISVDLGNGKVYQSERALQEEIDAVKEAISSLKEAKAALEDAIVSALVEDQPGLQERIDDIDKRLEELAETQATLEELLKSRVDVDVDVEAELSAEAELIVENTIILDKDIAALGKAVEILQNASSACTGAADALEAGSVDVGERAASLRDLADKAKAHVESVKQDLKDGLEPGAEKLKSDIAVLVKDLGQGADKLRALDPDLEGSLEAVATALGNASAKIGDADANLRTAADRMRELADAVDAALNSGDVEKLRSLLKGNAGDLAAALTAPVQVERTALFPSENFGSAMTPLYCTLALFIGSLLIMVVMSPTVSRRGEEELVNPKPRQLYLGRYLAVAAVSLMQTTLLGLGSMLFLKVQMADPLLFMLAFWFAGLVLSFMIYTLVVSFGNLGKAIAVLLLIVQVTACGGSFPLQMLPDFVQAISPWVPATYIVDAIQAAMMGVYQNDFWVSMGFLALFIVPFLLLGLALRKPMEGFLKFYVSKVEECGIME